MKKLFIASLVFSLLLASVSFAETLTINLETSTTDELKTARDAIDKRLAEIRLANAPTIDEAFTISGNGTQILPGINLDAPFSRFVVNCDDDIQVTYYSGSNNDVSEYGDYNSLNSYADYIVYPISISTIMVETQGNWKLDFSPISAMDTPYTSGTGSYISDLFVTTPPCIVTITFDGRGDSGYCSAYLYTIDQNGKISYSDKAVDSEYVYEPESFDTIIKPSNNVFAYFWKISCPAGTFWSINAK